MKAETSDNIAAAILVAIAALAYVTDSDAGDYRAGIMPHSYHFTDRKQFSNDNENVEGWNEDHKGILAEYRVTPEGDWLGVMTYKNSIGKTTWTVYGANDGFVHSGSVIDVGLMFGAATGYDWPVVPYVLPTMTVKFNDTLKSRVIAFPVGVAAQFYLEF